MKKLLITASVILSFAASPAFAKTQGNYLGIDILQTKSKVKSYSNSSDDSALSNYYSHNSKDSAVGFGLSYKYAFNFNDFFIAPTVFYQKLGTKATAGYSGNSNDPYSQSVSLNSRIGLGANFGYDITDKFSAYIPAGINVVSYDVKTSDESGSGLLSSKHSGNKSGYFYGLGFAFAATKDISLNLEYNRLSKLKLQSVSENGTLNGGTIIANASTDILKIGVSYNF